MGVEIERKYLVAGDGWREGAVGTPFRQGYLCAEPDRTVRVRVEGERARLTVKGRTVGLVRPEFEYDIPLADAEELFGLCPHPPLEKTRYRIEHGEHVWEVDEYRGANSGLVIVECELSSADETVDPPPWVGEEVTGDRRYANSRLFEHPYRSW